MSRAKHRQSIFLTEQDRNVVQWPQYWRKGWAKVCEINYYFFKYSFISVPRHAIAILTSVLDRYTHPFYSFFPALSKIYLLTFCESALLVLAVKWAKTPTKWKCVGISPVGILSATFSVSTFRKSAFRFLTFCYPPGKIIKLWFYFLSYYLLMQLFLQKKWPFLINLTPDNRKIEEKKEIGKNIFDRSKCEGKLGAYRG